MLLHSLLPILLTFTPSLITAEVLNPPSGFVFPDQNSNGDAPISKNAKRGFQKRTIDNWITLRNGKLWDGDKQFRFISYNVPGFLLLEDMPKCRSTAFGFPTCQNQRTSTTRDNNGVMYGTQNGQSCIIDPIPCTNTWQWLPPTLFEQESAAAAVAGMYGRVIRTYTLGFGPSHHVLGPRSYNEAAFVAMDNALDVARRFGLRLMIPIVNNWWGNPNDISSYGNYGQFTNFYGKSPTVFYTDRQVIDDFKALITYMLNRINTVNGIRYGDDMTVFCWELGNELGGWDQSPPPASWTIEIAQHIKSLAPRALVADGTLGGTEAPSRFRQEVLRSPAVELFSCHYYYGSSDLPRIKRDADHVSSFGKSFFIGEYGLNTVDLYTQLLEGTINNQVSGALMWSLRYHSRDGGFYEHGEDGGYLSYHVPGFPSGPGFHPQEKDTVNLIRRYALRINGMPADTPFPTPHPPEEIPGVHPYNLRWRGSVWAASFYIYRGTCSFETCATPDKWELIAKGVMDNVTSGNRIYRDSGAVVGRQYWYWVFPVSVQGVVGQGTQIGPLIC